jgi:20S proteasome subunit alpha 7
MQFISFAHICYSNRHQTCFKYFCRYGSNIPATVLADRVAAYVHYFTLHGSLRPFGTSALIASYDPETKQHSLNMVEPSGVSYSYFGCAAGKGRQPAKTEMEKLAINKSDAAENIDVREGVKQLARIIHLLHEEGKDKPFELEMSWICEESGWEHKGVPRDFIKEAVEWAKQDIEEAEGDDESDEDEEMED